MTSTTQTHTIARYFRLWVRLAKSKILTEPTKIIEILELLMAKSKTKKITLNVHRAIINDSVNLSLSEILDKVRTSDSGTSASIVNRDLYKKTIVDFPSFPKTNQSVAALFVLYEEGTAISTVGVGKKKGNLKVDTLNAPKGKEFVDRETIILVDGNYVVSCNLQQNQGALLSAIETIARKVGIEIPPMGIDFAEISNKLTVDKIRKVGVKKIRLNVSDLLGSIQPVHDGLISHIFGVTSGTAEYEQKNTMAWLELNGNGGSSPMTLDYDSISKNKWLSEAATQALQDDDVSAYTILLNDGTSWKNDELTLTKTVNIIREGSSYNVPDALQHMLNYIDLLYDEGRIK